MEIYTGLYFMSCFKETSFSFRRWADDVCDGSRHRNETGVIVQSCGRDGTAGMGFICTLC